MKTLKIIISSSLIAIASAVSISASADELMDIIHPESADLFPSNSGLSASVPTKITNLSDANGSNNIVWSYEYEEYVNSSDFETNHSINTVQNINRYLSENPTAAGKPENRVFKWDATYDGYMLQ